MAVSAIWDLELIRAVTNRENHRESPFPAAQMGQIFFARCSGPLARSHAYRAFEANDLPVQHPVLGDMHLVRTFGPNSALIGLANRKKRGVCRFETDLTGFENELAPGFAFGVGHVGLHSASQGRDNRQGSGRARAYHCKSFSLLAA